jgi:hypothetical protein
VAQSTIISTGFKSMAVLEVVSSRITVQPLTRLSLEALMSQGNAETVNVGLSAGRVRVEVNPPTGGRTDFTARTPNATASVRGTAFDMSPLSIQVTEGTVTYSGSNSRAVTVSAGQRSMVDAETGRVVNPAALAEAERRLPLLPGMINMPGADSGARFRDTRGTLDIIVTIVEE